MLKKIKDGIDIYISMKANIDHIALGAVDVEVEPKEASTLLKQIEKLGR